jgi:hypothetical protein
VVVEPDFMTADGTGYLLKQVAIDEDSPAGTATLCAFQGHPRATSFTVAFRNYLPTEREFGLGDADYILDRNGRPIQFTEGLVVPDRPDAVLRTGLTARDFDRAHQAVVPAFGEFWEQEGSFQTKSSRQFPTVSEYAPDDSVSLRVMETREAGRSQRPAARRQSQRLAAARRPQRLAAPRRFVAAAAAALVVGVAALIAFLVAGHGGTAEPISGPDDDGKLTVDFTIEEPGGAATATVTAAADASALYACRDKSGDFPNSADKKNESARVSASDRVTPDKNGQTTGSLQLRPPQSTLVCLPGQDRKLVEVTFTSVVIDKPGAGPESFPGPFTRTFF